MRRPFVSAIGATVALVLLGSPLGPAAAQGSSDSYKKIIDDVNKLFDEMDRAEAREAAAKAAAKKTKSAKEAADKLAKAMGLDKIPRPPAGIKGGKVTYRRAGRCVIVNLRLGEPPDEAAIAAKARQKKERQRFDAEMKALRERRQRERPEQEAWEEHEMHGFQPMLGCPWCDEAEYEAQKREHEKPGEKPGTKGGGKDGKDGKDAKAGDKAATKKSKATAKDAGSVSRAIICPLDTATGQSFQFVATCWSGGCRTGLGYSSEILAHDEAVTGTSAVATPFTGTDTDGGGLQDRDRARDQQNE